MAMGLYELHQVEREDLNEGWIWLRNEDLNKTIENRRPVLLVRDTVSGKKTYCEGLYADDTYLGNRRHPIPKDHQRNLVFLSAWYRRRLGIENEPIPCTRQLEIRIPNFWKAVCWQFRACALHPQIVVVLSTVLAIVGTGLGFLGAAAIFKDVQVIWYVLGPFGVLIMLFGFLPLVCRVRS